MSVGSNCTRKVITINQDESLVTAAALMRENCVGYLIVVEPFLGRRTPIGVLTDRDIVVKVIAKGVDAQALAVRDVMTRGPLVAKEDADVEETLQRMRGMGVRRVPVVGTAGELTGVLSLNDVVDHRSREFSNVVGSVRNQQRFEHPIGG